MLKLSLTVASVAIGGLATADETHHANVMICLSQMDQGTSWNTCRTMLFAPCAEHQVGSEDHLACLTNQRAGWETLIAAQQTDLNNNLREDAKDQFADLMTQWTSYVAAKCQDVADSRASISRDAALSGCEISEAAGLALELHACLGGGSQAPYCALED